MKRTIVRRENGRLRRIAASGRTRAAVLVALRAGPAEAETVYRRIRISTPGCVAETLRRLRKRGQVVVEATLASRGRRAPVYGLPGGAEAAAATASAEKMRDALVRAAVELLRAAGAEALAEEVEARAGEETRT